MSLAPASRPGDNCVPASGLHSYAGNEPHATVRLRTGTTLRRVAGLDESRASGPGMT